MYTLDASYIQPYQQEIDRSINATVLRDVLSTIKPIYRDVLLLYYTEEKSYSEIADIIEKPIGTVSTYMSRAKTAANRLPSQRQGDEQS